MKIIASGTFDHLHDGHKYFLRTAFSYGHVLIGLSTDHLLSGKCYRENIQSYAVRKKCLFEWLAKEGKESGEDFAIIPISTPEGFSVEMEDVDAILVTADNESVGKRINASRAKKGYAPLKIITCTLIFDKKGKLSSTRIRADVSSGQ